MAARRRRTPEQRAALRALYGPGGYKSPAQEAREARNTPAARSGMAARFAGTCERCPEPIKVNDRIVPRGTGMMHVGCAPGADDE